MRLVSVCIPVIVSMALMTASPVSYQASQLFEQAEPALNVLSYSSADENSDMCLRDDEMVRALCEYQLCELMENLLLKRTEIIGNAMSGENETDEITLRDRLSEIMTKSQISRELRNLEEWSDSDAERIIGQEILEIKIIGIGAEYVDFKITVKWLMAGYESGSYYEDTGRYSAKLLPENNDKIIISEFVREN